MQPSEFRLVSSVEELPEPSDAALQFIAAWKAARRRNLVPLKRNFDPLSIPHLLPDIFMYRYDPESDSFVCRLAGERVNASWGYPITGKTSREILGEADAPMIEEIWHRILTTPLLHYGNAERLSGNLLYAAERVVAPLADDEGDVTIILGLSRYSLGGLTRITARAILPNAVHIDCRDI